MNESDLIQRAKRNDSDAFCELVEQYTNPLFNHIYKILQNREDSEDALQNTYIKAYRALSSFKFNSTFKTWLYRIATNVCYDELRKRKNKTSISLQQTNAEGEYVIEVPDNTYSPEAHIGNAAAAEALKAALYNLTEEQRMIITLRDIDGFSYEDIAEITSIPLGTVKSRISRARIALKKLLEKDKELFV